MEIPVKLMGKPMLFAGRVAEISDNKDVVARTDASGSDAGGMELR